MLTPEDKSNAAPGTIPGVKWIYDYERCTDYTQLRFVMENINRNQYQLISRYTNIMNMPSQRSGPPQIAIPL